MQKIYLDHAATTPTDPEVIQAMEPFFFKAYGNPSSPHRAGREANKAIEDARKTIADIIGASSDEIIFTSGATEANNQAIFGAARNLKDKGNHIIISKVEHHSVIRPAEILEKEGFTVSFLNVSKDGVIDSEELLSLIKEDTILICVMYANNEIGTIQPVAEIGKIAQKKGILFLVDAVQVIGHIPINVKDISADMVSMSAHKFYGPKGIGALYIKKGVKVPNLLYGGDQEKGMRASTQNTAGIVGMAKALELCRESMQEEAKKQKALRDQIIERVASSIKGAHLNGSRDNRLPNNAHFSFENIEGESLIMALDMVGIEASMGSACTSGAMEASHTLKAIGLDDDLAFGSLRITVGRWTQQKDIDYFLDELPSIIERLRA